MASYWEEMFENKDDESQASGEHDVECAKPPAVTSSTHNDQLHPDDDDDEDVGQKKMQASVTSTTIPTNMKANLNMKTSGLTNSAAVEKGTAKGGHSSSGDKSPYPKTASPKIAPSATSSSTPNTSQLKEGSSKTGSENVVVSAKGSSHLSIPGAFARVGPDGGAAETGIDIDDEMPPPSLVRSSHTSGTMMEMFDSDGQDGDLANADLVDDAEPVVYAKNVERADLLYKNPIFLGLIGVLSLGALVSMILVLTLNDGGEDNLPQGDPRCWTGPPEDLSIPMQCYCFNSTKDYVDKADLNTMMEDYFFFQGVLRNFGALQDDEFFLTNTSYIEEGDKWDQNEILYSCDSVHQSVLLLTTLGNDDSQATLRGKPASVIVDWFTLAYTYVTMNGINWDRSDMWLNSVQTCEWYGVYCHFYNTLSKFDLSNNNLSGTIPRFWGYFTTVDHLDMSGNPHIIGTIPSELSQMSGLRDILLGNCSLTGTIPSQLIYLELLDSLRLGGNQLTGSIPPELFVGKSFVDRKNQFETNDELATNVVEETSYENHNLRFLTLSDNRLSGSVPAEIRYAKRLTRVQLQGNYLQGTLPSSMGELSYLELLNVGRNNFSGHLPEMMGCMPRLYLMNFYESGLQHYRSSSPYNETGSGSSLIPESFCPDNNVCGKPSLVQGRKILIQCNATADDCSCCKRSHLGVGEEANMDDFLQADVQLTCADYAPDVVV